MKVPGLTWVYEVAQEPLPTPTPSPRGYWSESQQPLVKAEQRSKGKDWRRLPGLTATCASPVGKPHAHAKGGDQLRALPGGRSWALGRWRPGLCLHPCTANTITSGERHPGPCPAGPQAACI